MSLGDFFRINLPYGIKRNFANEWFAFNREYMPLGWNSTQHKKSIFDDTGYLQYPIYTKYKGVTEKELIKIAQNESAIHRNERGEIQSIFLYNDRTNPQNDPKFWPEYFEKIKLLSKFTV